MRKINAFNFLTINGYFKGVNDDTGWHVHGEEGKKYSEDKLQAGNILLFGRKTYEMMYSFWPTKMAHELYPVVAEKMNAAEKIVLSNTLKIAEWQHTSILRGNTIEQIRRLKLSPGKNISILGSGSVITQLTDADLIDEYEFLIDPVAIGKGTVVFENIKQDLKLNLMASQVFKKSGAVLLTYHKDEQKK